MESGFWTQGPIPLRLLEGLALDRPEAMETCRTALDQGDVAVVGGPAGSGRTTFAHQMASKWPHASVLIDVQALLDVTEEAMARDVLAARGVPSPAEPTWDDVARRVKGRILFIVDGAPKQADWLDRLLDRVPGAFLLLRDDGVPLDPIPDRSAREFLVRRSTPRWDPAALAEALRIARGRPDVLQRIGAAATYRAAVERGASDSGEVGADAVLAAATEVAHHLPAGAAMRLAQLSPARLRLLRAMAFDPDATPTKWGSRSGLPAASVPVHMQRLRDEDRLVERVERGRYRILDPLVALHLRTVHGNPVRIYRPL